MKDEGEAKVDRKGEDENLMEGRILGEKKKSIY